MIYPHFPVDASRDQPLLRDRDVHLWRVDLSGDASLGMDAILDASEQERAARFVFVRDRNRYLHAHHALRVLLGAYLCMPPKDVRIEHGRHGKPFLNGQSLGFNISHSADCGIVAISRASEIGVDLEVLKLPHETRRFAESVFSVSELDALSAVPEMELAAAFFSCWTRKEAYLKALGIGFTINPSTVTVGIGQARARLPLPERNAIGFVEVACTTEQTDRVEAVAVVGGFSRLDTFKYDRQWLNEKN
jgi:4'-phosphopantetheinyl transferase